MDYAFVHARCNSTRAIKFGTVSALWFLINVFDFLQETRQITGAPKVRAMEIIAEHLDNVLSIGLMEYDPELDKNGEAVEVALSLLESSLGKTIL